jgi:hypothetical protein
MYGKAYLHYLNYGSYIQRSYVEDIMEKSFKNNISGYSILEDREKHVFLSNIEV